jgi:hypothetical protein
MRKTVILLTLLGLSFLGGVSALAEVSGLVEWRYADYAAKEDGKTVADASHFTQLYSLLYEKSGLISGGRAGKYDLGLGAQWSSVDSTFNGQNLDANELKLLYRGDLILAPGGLPFNLHLYSHDMRLPTWVYDSQGLDYDIIDPYMVGGMYSGQHVQTGATLMVGIRNGSYLGKYRETLSQLPRLLIDYREDYVRDVDNDTPQHYRTRNLAFVSLNKKDNWFHYRLYDYTDFEDELENYQETTYMLGTVDHAMTRQWINFTNWIKISTDASYIVSNRNSLGEVPERTYNYNLFAVAARRDWRASAFPTFSRTTEGGSIEKNIEVPLFFQHEVSKDTAYRMRLIAARETDVRYDRSLREDESNVYFAASADLHRTRAHQLTPRFEAEWKTGTEGKGYGVSTGFEYFTNRAHRPPVDWFTSYSLTRIDGTAEDGADVEYWENQLLGRLEGMPTSALRTGVEQRLVFGSGMTDTSVTRYIDIVGDTSLTASSSGRARRDGSVLRSTTSWFADHRATRALSNRFEMIYDYLATDEGKDSQVALRHSLRYDRRAFLARMRNELTFGDDLSGMSVGSENLGTGSGLSSVDKTFYHNTSLRYSPGRIWEVRGDVDYYWQDGSGGTVQQIFATQEYRYSFFRNSGAVRKFVELREEFEYEKFMEADGDSQSMYSLLLGAELYPTYSTLLGLRGRYRVYQPEDYDEYLCTLTAGVNFPKFMVSFDYSYGIRTAYNDEAKRNEHRWEVKVRKTF